MLTDIIHSSRRFTERFNAINDHVTYNRISKTEIDYVTKDIHYLQRTMRKGNLKRSILNDTTDERYATQTIENLKQYRNKFYTKGTHVNASYLSDIIDGKEEYLISKRYDHIENEIKDMEKHISMNDYDEISYVKERLQEYVKQNKEVKKGKRLLKKLSSFKGPKKKRTSFFEKYVIRNLAPFSLLFPFNEKYTNKLFDAMTPEYYSIRAY